MEPTEDPRGVRQSFPVSRTSPSAMRRSVEGLKADGTSPKSPGGSGSNPRVPGQCGVTTLKRLPEFGEVVAGAV
jgi:hypothetical protein